MMSPELMAAAAKLIGVLVLIVGGLLAFNVYSRRFLRTGLGPGPKTVQVLESTPIGLKKTVTLVKVPGAVLVVGITNDRMTLLDRLAEADYQALRNTEPARPLPTFQDHLRRFTGGWPVKSAQGDGADAPDTTPC
jgi:flagellar biogenesis protein FliO